MTALPILLVASVFAREKLLTLEEGRDRFYPGNARPVVVDGRLVVTNERQCTAFNHVRHPGMRPFASTEDIVLTCSTGLPGVVVLNLIDAETEAPLRIKAPWERETHFRTNLPPARIWQIKSFEFWRNKGKTGTFPPFVFTVDGVEGICRTTAAAACRLDVDTGNELHLVRGEGEAPVLTLKNVADRTIAWRGTLRCLDYLDKGVDVPIDCTVKAGETARVPLPGPFAKGVWRVGGELTADDGSKAKHETRFAVLDRHIRTPRLPRGAQFRVGINWHAGRFSERDRWASEDALEACGCKLVRAGGFSFSAIEPVEGRVDWTRSDAIMAETESRGISLDTTLYSPPAWTQDAARKARVPHRKKTMVPSREGTFGAYAERLAARYGTKIDYYEMGNEWDLIPAAAFTADEAVRVHREGYEGLKRGNPEVNVICNGWTAPNVRPDHYGPSVSVGTNFLATVMPQIRDMTSCFPIHMHSPFRSFRKRVKQFLALRHRLGCDDLPWYANETARSSVHGQEVGVARDVFRKVMYAWAHGSIDYIWYNLVATGWLPDDPEQGYGLLTADFHPRAGFAAMSAFNAVYAGLRFQDTLIDRSTRLAYRFASERDGERLLVLGGWDEAAVKGCPIRVRTDAARAFAVDLMGNRTAVPVTDGTVVWNISLEPSSLMLFGATRAEPDAKDLANIPVLPGSVREILAGPIPGRKPDFVLRTADRVNDDHQAIPEARHRVWQGPDDLSCVLWFVREGDDLRVRVAVRDDIDTAGDGVRVIWQVPGGEPRSSPLRRLSREKTISHYETVVKGTEGGFDAARLKAGLHVNVEVTEDDGFGGRDATLVLTDDTEPMKLMKFN